MERKIKPAKKVTSPDVFGKMQNCPVCGGQFKVTSEKQLEVRHFGQTPKLIALCPYCSKDVVLDYDIYANFREKLSAFIMSQVQPIKAITDESIRLPMQKLLDDINALVQDY